MVPTTCVTLDDGAVDELEAAVGELVESGELPSAQFALAHNGRILAFETYGPQTAEEPALYTGFSVIKAVTSSALWLLLEDRQLDLEDAVAEHVTEFATNGKEAVGIGHLLTHTAGFPAAPFAAGDWDNTGRRAARFRQWRLDWAPGSRFVYHPVATMWVVAALIESVTESDYRIFIRNRVLSPLGLDDLYLGLGDSAGIDGSERRNVEDRIADLVAVGRPPRPDSPQSYILPEDLEAEGGFLDVCNSSSYREVGVPGGGGIMTARALAMLYQALMRDGRAVDHNNGASENATRLWKRETIQNACRIHSRALTDPMTGVAANRGLGLVIAGDENRVFRSFGERCSPSAVGHAGMGGQVAWGDPETGLSFAFLTNGFDRDPLRAGARGVRLSSLAAECVKR